MKNVFKALEVKQGDNGFTRIAKGGFVGTLSSAATLSVIFGAFGLIGKLVNRNDEVDAFNKEMGAE